MTDQARRWRYVLTLQLDGSVWASSEDEARACATLDAGDQLDGEPELLATAALDVEPVKAAEAGSAVSASEGS